jgi:hypothetical protein
VVPQPVIGNKMNKIHKVNGIVLVTATTVASSIGLAAITVSATGCAQLAAVGSNIGNIASIVISDILAGKPFDQILADTKSADAQLLVDIIYSIENDPMLSPADKAKYVTACAPYLVQAQTLAAKQAAEKTSK